MATYKMDKEVQEIAEITGKTIEELVIELKLNNGLRGCEAWNRSEQNSVLARLSEVRKEKRAKEIRQERLAGFHWVKLEGEWRVAGDFNGVKEGSLITVVKASGEKQEEIVVEISGDKQSAQVK